MHELLSHRQMPMTQRNLIVCFPLKILRPSPPLEDQLYALLPSTCSSLSSWEDYMEGSFLHRVCMWIVFDMELHVGAEGLIRDQYVTQGTGLLTQVL